MAKMNYRKCRCMGRFQRQPDVVEGQRLLWRRRKKGGGRQIKDNGARKRPTRGRRKAHPALERSGESSETIKGTMVK